MRRVIDRAARLRGFVRGAEVLPFARAHLGTCLRGAMVVEERDDKDVEVTGEAPGQLVAPERVLSIFWGCCKTGTVNAGERVRAVGARGVRDGGDEAGEVFLELERRVKVGKRGEGRARGHVVGLGTGADTAA